MQFHIHRNTRRVIYFTLSEETFLQQLEGVAERVVLNDVPNFTNNNCVDFIYQNVFSKSDVPVPDEVVILNRKAHILNDIELMATKVRYPYLKKLVGQDLVYDLKHDQAITFLGLENPILDNFAFIKDEAEIQGVDPKIAALQITRLRQELNWILLCSERARRLLTNKCCLATTLEQLSMIEQKVNKRNFKLPIEIKNDSF